MTTTALERNAHGLREADFADLLMTPPAHVSSLDDTLDDTLRRRRFAESDLLAGFDAESFSWHRRDADERGDLEYVRLARGVWLTYGDIQVSGTQFSWQREDRALSFSVLLRGAVMVGMPLAAQSRFVYTDGCALATACLSDTLICRHSLPGVHCQGVSVLFDDDEAVRDFGLDPTEVRQWIDSAQPAAARSDRTARVALSMSNLPATRAAQAILWTSFSGSRRRLYLRSKVGEMICHLLAGAALTPGAVSRAENGPRQDDESLAAVVHAALSDPEDCPDIGDLAARLQVSTGRLVAAFKARYGMSPREHAIATRMARARRLLLQTRTSLLDVALTCGYEHHSSFSTAYRRAFGETPLETRRAGSGA